MSLVDDIRHELPEVSHAECPKAGCRYRRDVTKETVAWWAVSRAPRCTKHQVPLRLVTMAELEAVSS